MSECDDRKEITLEELAAAKKAGASLADVQVTGLVKIIDKHGKVKSEFNIERVTPNAN